MLAEPIQQALQSTLEATATCKTIEQVGYRTPCSCASSSVGQQLGVVQANAARTYVQAVRGAVQQHLCVHLDAWLHFHDDIVDPLTK